jgi:hypothetical protein
MVVFDSTQTDALRPKRLKTRDGLMHEQSFFAELIAAIPGFFVVLDENARLVQWNDGLSL